MNKYSIFYKRNRALDAAYKRIIKASKGVAKHITRKTIIALIQEQPAPRFYITAETARLYIKNYCKPNSNSIKQAMIADLLENYNRLKQENPAAPKEWLYEVVVEQPAKSFYMSAKRIEEIIFYRLDKKGR